VYPEWCPAVSLHCDRSAEFAGQTGATVAGGVAGVTFKRRLNTPRFSRSLDL